MSIVIIGGNERMQRQYETLCKQYKCKPKVFTTFSNEFKKQIGQPDLMVLFTSTVSHKMVRSATQTASKFGVDIARSHSSSASALKKILEEYC